MYHTHQYKKYDWQGCCNFSGEVVREFRVCKICDKAQEYFMGWQDLSEEATAVLLRKIETGEIVERKRKR